MYFGCKVTNFGRILIYRTHNIDDKIVSELNTSVAKIGEN